MHRTTVACTAGQTHILARRAAWTTAIATLAIAACTLVLAATSAHAAPPAGTPIGNQASATYLDATSTSRTGRPSSSSRNEPPTIQASVTAGAGGAPAA